jgi:hypothetical protein
MPRRAEHLLQEAAAAQQLLLVDRVLGPDADSVSTRNACRPQRRLRFRHRLERHARVVGALYEQHGRARAQFLEQAGFASQVEVILRSAVDMLLKVIARTEEPFDLVFQDADKVNYSTYFSEIMKRISDTCL